MWPFSKKKVEEKPIEQIPTEQEPWFIVNVNYHKEYGDLYVSKYNTILWKRFYENGTTHVDGIPVSCFEEYTRAVQIQRLIVDRLGIADPFMYLRYNQFSFERNNIVKEALDKLKKFKSEHELDDLETKVIDNMIKKYSKEDK